MYLVCRKPSLVEAENTADQLADAIITRVASPYVYYSNRATNLYRATSHLVRQCVRCIMAHHHTLFQGRKYHMTTYNTYNTYHTFEGGGTARYARQREVYLRA